MPDVVVRFNTDQMVSAFDQLGRRGEFALRRAFKRTAISVRTVMAAAIAKDVGGKQADIKSQVKLAINAQEVEATISTKGARIPVIDLKALGPEPSRGRGRGVSWQTQGGQRAREPQAFIATMSNGHRGVFIKAKSLTKKSRGAWSKNLPIKELFGPSLPHVFAKYVPLGIERAQEQLVKNLEHEFAFALSQE